MPGVTKCFTPFQAQVLRATRLDACGAPVTGSKSKLVTDGLISVEMKLNYDEGTEVRVKNAKGAIKVSNPGCPTLNYIDATLTLTGVDPDLFEIFTKMPLVTDGQGNAVGFRARESIACTYGVAIETWTLIDTDSGNCAGGTQTYGYFLLPFLVNGKMGDVKLDENAMSATLTARTKRGSLWGTGPATYLVADSSTTSTPTAAVLGTAITAQDHMHMQLTPIAPPAAACGAVALP